jgi:hypothetical protein
MEHELAFSFRRLDRCVRCCGGAETSGVAQLSSKRNEVKHDWLPSDLPPTTEMADATSALRVSNRASRKATIASM